MRPSLTSGGILPDDDRVVPTRPGAPVIDWRCADSQNRRRDSRSRPASHSSSISVGLSPMIFEFASRESLEPPLSHDWRSFNPKSE